MKKRNALFAQAHGLGLVDLARTTWAAAFAKSLRLRDADFVLQELLEQLTEEKARDNADPHPEG